MITTEEMRFCIKVVVTGKGNLQKPCQFIIDSHGAKAAKREAHLYVPANVTVTVSRGLKGSQEHYMKV